jgi:membrane protein implicated in regulation of membrane protease activity
MIDAMWMWGVLGLVLLAIEMGTGTIYILWFGIAALCLAIATWVFTTIPVAIQFAIFAALSIGSLAIWKLNYKKNETHSRVGQAQGFPGRKCRRRQTLHYGKGLASASGAV